MAYDAGYQVIAGLDEVGRGPLLLSPVVSSSRHCCPKRLPALQFGVLDSNPAFCASQSLPEIREVAASLKIVAIPPAIWPW